LRDVDGVLRVMTSHDILDVLAVQRPGSVAGLAEVFPQDHYPFPGDVIAARWANEVVDPEVDCYVVVADGSTVGFAAVQGNQLLHFGIAIELWGTGIATCAHDEVVDRMREASFSSAWLRVFVGNGRGRGFYEKLGWRDSGERTQSTFPPHPVLARYELEL
jgi:RimJ/RimL family protein N-acetyltransferase